MTDNKELIALVSEFLESVHAGEWTGDVSRDEALVALESLTQQLAELQAKLEDALKDRVALAMALDCGHRPPCEECRLYSPAAQQAQPEQVNAMLLEALEAAEKLEHAALVALSEATYELKVGNTYTTATDTYKANNDLIHRLDKILNSQYRDRKRTAIAAAKQAQLARPINCGTGHCSCIECSYEQAQPERAPLCEKQDGVHDAIYAAAIRALIRALIKEVDE